MIVEEKLQLASKALLRVVREARINQLTLTQINVLAELGASGTSVIQADLQVPSAYRNCKDLLDRGLIVKSSSGQGGHHFCQLSEKGKKLVCKLTGIPTP